MACFSRRRDVQSLMDISNLVRRIFASSRDLFLSVRTLLHFSRQFAVQSLHHLIVFSIWAALARASSSSLYNVWQKKDVTIGNNQISFKNYFFRFPVYAVKVASRKRDNRMLIQIWRMMMDMYMVIVKMASAGSPQSLLGWSMTVVSVGHRIVLITMCISTGWVLLVWLLLLNGQGWWGRTARVLTYNVSTIAL